MEAAREGLEDVKKLVAEARAAGADGDARLQGALDAASPLPVTTAVVADACMKWAYKTRCPAAPRCAPLSVVWCHGAVPRAPRQGHWVLRPSNSEGTPPLGVARMLPHQPRRPHPVEAGVPGNRHVQLG